MSKKLDFRLEKVARPPEGVAWLWHTVDLLTSPAWRARSDQLVRLLDLLEVEHLKNGGAENGHIHQTYSQIQAGGIARKYIAATIGEGDPGRRVGGQADADLYRPDGGAEPLSRQGPAEGDG